MGSVVWLGWCGTGGAVVPIRVRKERAGPVRTGDEDSGTRQLGCSDASSYMFSFGISYSSRS
jgi:hypothetical protein